MTSSASERTLSTDSNSSQGATERRDSWLPSATSSQSSLTEARIALNEELLRKPPKERRAPVYTTEERNAMKPALWRCQCEEPLRELSDRLVDYFEGCQASLWTNGVGGSERRLKAKFYEPKFFSCKSGSDRGLSVMLRHWSQDDLDDVATYLVDRFTSGTDWQLFCDLSDPWDGKGPYRPNKYAYFELSYTMQHTHSNKEEAIPRSCRRRMEEDKARAQKVLDNMKLAQREAYSKTVSPRKKWLGRLG